MTTYTWQICTFTVHLESIHSTPPFPHFVTLHFYCKNVNIFPSKFYRQQPLIKTWKKNIYDFLIINTYISIHSFFHEYQNWAQVNSVSTNDPFFGLFSISSFKYAAIQTSQYTYTNPSREGTPHHLSPKQKKRGLTAYKIGMIDLITLV